MAGSGIRGQFEEKFKALLRDIEDEVYTLWLFSRKFSLPWGTTFRRGKLSVLSMKFVSNSHV